MHVSGRSEGLSLGVGDALDTALLEEADGEDLVIDTREDIILSLKGFLKVIAGVQGGGLCDILNAFFFICRLRGHDSGSESESEVKVEQKECYSGRILERTGGRKGDG